LTVVLQLTVWLDEAERFGGVHLNSQPRFRGCAHDPGSLAPMGQAFSASANAAGQEQHLAEVDRVDSKGARDRHEDMLDVRR
jgi:hypothetical protein